MRSELIIKTISGILVIFITIWGFFKDNIISTIPYISDVVWVYIFMISFFIIIGLSIALLLTHGLKAFNIIFSSYVFVLCLILLWLDFTKVITIQQDYVVYVAVFTTIFVPFYICYSLFKKKKNRR